MLVVSTALLLPLAGVPASAPTSADAVELLVFTKTTGFRHDSIPAGIAAVQAIAMDRGWVATATEDAAMFEPTALAEFQVVVFLSTTGDVLDDAQQTAFVEWVQGGGGFVGIHSASNTEEEWLWFVGLLGGTTFADHPAPQDATIHVAVADHLATMGLPDPWVRFDEWYNFDSQPSATVEVLLRLDETTYTGGTMGADHPIAWAHHYEGGRAFYTALGHTNESWAEPEFLAHVEGAIEWASIGDPVGGESGSDDAGSEDGGALDTSGGADTNGDGASSSGPALPSTSGGDDGVESTAIGTSEGTTSGANESEDDAGCGCAAGPSAAPSWPSWLALAVLGLIRRRSGTRARRRPRAERRDAFAHATQRRTVAGMGDKSPKAKAKNKQQDKDHKKQEQAVHDKKQAPPPTTIPGKAK